METTIYSAEENAAVTVMEVRGEVDFGEAGADRLCALMHGLVASGARFIVVDLSETTYMDSSGVATLVEVLKRCRRCGCQLKLAGLVERVRNVFEICRLESMFQIYDSEAEALS